MCLYVACKKRRDTQKENKELCKLLIPHAHSITRSVDVYFLTAGHSQSMWDGVSGAHDSGLEAPCDVMVQHLPYCPQGVRADGERHA